MRDLSYQTKQAFLFSLVFYFGTLVLFLLKVSIAPILFSMGLLVSMIWVILVLREVMTSTRISNIERICIALFVIIGNIIAGLVYFALIRSRVIGQQHTKK